MSYDKHVGGPMNMFKRLKDVETDLRDHARHVKVPASWSTQGIVRRAREEKAKMSRNAVEEARSFISEKLPGWKKTWSDQEDTWEARCAWQRILATSKWVAPGWPVEYGGQSLGVRETLDVENLMVEMGAPQIPGMLGVKNVGPTIQVWGTAKQKGHLSRILSTDEVWCQGFSEPGAGSDLASLQTTATLDGDDFVVNGQKIWTSNGDVATHMQLLVRTDPSASKHAGISALLVDMNTPGIEVRPILQMTGESGFAEVFFTDVRVPIANLLGPINEGWRVTMSTLGHERAGIALFASRLEKRAREAVESQIAEGVAADSIEMDLLISRYVECRVVGMLGQNLLHRVDAGEQPGAEQSVIKVAWSETSQRLERTLVDFDGIGVILGTNSEAVHSYLTAPSATIAAGTTQVVKNVIAERVLGLPR